MMLHSRWLASLLALFLFTTAAHAHISLDQAGTHKSRYGDQSIKQGPCGAAGGVRGTNVYTYSAGETITVELRETISHPSYFRFAFDEDGDDVFVDPQSINPPYRECMSDAQDRCGADDFYNNESVLPGLDNLNIHNYGQPTNYSWEVALPDVECDNCTLQVIQVMEDPPPIHAPYTPGTEDIYYQCIDLVLQRAPGSGAGTPGPGTSPSSGGEGGGCSTVTHPAFSRWQALGVFAVGLVGWCIRTRRRGGRTPWKERRNR